MSPIMQFQLRVYTASIAGQRVRPSTTTQGVTVDARAANAWADVRAAMDTMPQWIKAELEHEETLYRAARSG